MGAESLKQLNEEIRAEDVERLMDVTTDIAAEQNVSAQGVAGWS